MQQCGSEGRGVSGDAGALCAGPWGRCEDSAFSPHEREIIRGPEPRRAPLGCGEQTDVGVQGQFLRGGCCKDTGESCWGLGPGWWQGSREKGSDRGEF